MPMRHGYRPPPRDVGAMLAAAGPVAAEMAAGSILETSQPLVPVEEGILKASGRVVPHGTGFAVTYGRDDDGDGTHAPSNKYAARVHEDLTAHHPNGGQAKYLETALHSGRAGARAAAASVIRKALH